MSGPELPLHRCDGRVLLCAGAAAVMLGLMLTANRLGAYLFRSWKWYGVIFGTVLMLTAVVFHRGGKKHKLLYVFSLLFNGIGNGFSLSALYIDLPLSASIRQNLPGVLPGLCIVLLAAVILMAFPARKKIAAWACVSLVIVALAVCIIGICKSSGREGVFWRFSLFGAMLSAMFLLPMGMLSGHPERSVLRCASFAGFGAFILITLVVVLLLSEGELLDGLDLSFGGSSRKKPGKKPKWP